MRPLLIFALILLGGCADTERDHKVANSAATIEQATEAFSQGWISPADMVDILFAESRGIIVAENAVFPAGSVTSEDTAAYVAAPAVPVFSWSMSDTHAALAAVAVEAKSTAASAPQGINWQATILAVLGSGGALAGVLVSVAKIFPQFGPIVSLVELGSNALWHTTAPAAAKQADATNAKLAAGMQATAAFLEQPEFAEIKAKLLARLPAKTGDVIQAVLKSELPPVVTPA